MKFIRYHEETYFPILSNGELLVFYKNLLFSCAPDMEPVTLYTDFGPLEAISVPPLPRGFVELLKTIAAENQGDLISAMLTVCAGRNFATDDFEAKAKWASSVDMMIASLSQNRYHCSISGFYEGEDENATITLTDIIESHCTESEHTYQEEDSTMSTAENTDDILSMEELLRLAEEAPTADEPAAPVIEEETVSDNEMPIADAAVDAIVADMLGEAPLAEEAPVIPEEPLVMEEPAPVIPEEPLVMEEPAPVIPEEPLVTEEPAPVIPEEPLVTEEPAPVIPEEPLAMEETPLIPDEPLIMEEPIIPEEPLLMEEPVIPEEPLLMEEPVIPEEPLLMEEPVIPDGPLVMEEPAPVIPEEPAAVEEAPVIPEEPVAMEETPIIPEEPAAMEEAPIIPEKPAAMEETPIIPEEPAAMEEAPIIPEEPAAMEEAPIIPEEPVAVEENHNISEEPAAVSAESSPCCAAGKPMLIPMNENSAHCVLCVRLDSDVLGIGIENGSAIMISDDTLIYPEGESLVTRNLLTGDKEDAPLNESVLAAFSISMEYFAKENETYTGISLLFPWLLKSLIQIGTDPGTAAKINHYLAFIGCGIKCGEGGFTDASGNSLTVAEVFRKLSELKI